MVQTEEGAKLFGFSVECWPKWMIIIVASAGIFSTFLLHGIGHEKLCSGFQFSETVFLTFAQFLGYAGVAFPTLISNIRTRFRGLRAPFRAYAVTAFALMMSMSLGNFAAIRLSYPTQVLFKSSKLIPVMIGNVIFLHKRPKSMEVVSVMLIVLGLIGISLGDFRGKNKFDAIGICAVIGALCFDAVASNMEDKVMSHYGASQSELISMIYTMGAVSIGIVSILMGQMAGGIVRLTQNPVSLLYLFLFAVMGALGIQFVYLVMKVFGSLVTVMTTSLRKALTVCLSFIVFRDKKFTSWHAGAIILLATGMGLNIYEKTGNKKKEEIVDEEKMLTPLQPVQFEKRGEHL
jgi:adenosine 3'-phospho 5'-phosphosulfate transporter B3